MNRGHEGSTNPEQIPPTHVLVAAQEQDRKETEDLLAGFDRPGRGPKLPAPERDFVDYYAKKKDGSPVSDRNANARPNTSPMPPAVRPAPKPKPKQANISTVVVPRSKPIPLWMTWGGAVVVMLLLGGAVAYLASRDDASARGNASATTSSITSAPPSVISSRDDIPPPPPPSEVDPALTADNGPTPPVATAPSPRPSGKRGTTGSTASSTTANAALTATNAASPPSTAPAPSNGKVPPRDDFIRDMGAPK